MVKKRWWRIYKCLKKFNFFFIQVFKKEVILLIDKYDRIRKLLEERENININSVADELFEEDEKIKGKYKEFIFKTVHNDDFEIDKSWVEENFKKRVLKTSDNSITIVINGNQLEDKNKIIIKKTDDNDKKVDLTIKNVILEDKR